MCCVCIFNILSVAPNILQDMSKSLTSFLILPSLKSIIITIPFPLPLIQALLYSSPIYLHWCLYHPEHSGCKTYIGESRPEFDGFDGVENLDKFFICWSSSSHSVLLPRTLMEWNLQESNGEKHGEDWKYKDLAIVT